MSHNLRARLARIRKVQGEAGTAPGKDSGKPGASSSPWNNQPECTPAPDRSGHGWQESGYKVMRRTLKLPFALPEALPETLPWLVPDLARNRYSTPGDATPGVLPGGILPDGILPDGILPDRFLFFDLETTGLSGGAGTVAFLAAFGRFVCNTQVPNSVSGLEVTQFLLLDYPGEDDFLEQVLAFISPPGSSPYFLTTYNGKTFDTQIIKTRCLLNGFTLPPFFQVDLLHPARRLWKRILPNCSQATIETMVLGLDRSGDTPGSLAPDIWFTFLRSGEGEFPNTENGQMPEPCRALLGICDHNVKDISGLAALFRAFTEIAASPLDASGCFNCDEENLAERWRHGVRHNGLTINETHEKTAALLLKAAAAKYPRSCLRLGFNYMRQGFYEEGKAALERLTNNDSVWKVPCTDAIQAIALRSLAVNEKRQRKRPRSPADS